MKRKAVRRNSGFTLIEMIVATFLLAIGVTGALAAFSSATRATSMAEQIDTASILAQRRLSEAELQSGSPGGEQQGEFEDYPGYRWRQNAETTDYDGLYKVTVTISWGEPSHPQTREFVTYLREKNDQQNGNASSQSPTGLQNRSNSNGGNRLNGNGGP